MLAKRPLPRLLDNFKRSDRTGLIEVVILSCSEVALSQWRSRDVKMVCLIGHITLAAVSSSCESLMLTPHDPCDECILRVLIY
jgi:hypothetical protein